MQKSPIDNNAMKPKRRIVMPPSPVSHLINRRLQARRITARLWLVGSQMTAQSLLGPNFAGDFHHERELRELLIFRQQIAERSRSKSALGRKRELLKIDILCRRINAPFDVVLLLKRSLLAG